MRPRKRVDRMTQEKATLPAEEVKQRLRTIKGRIEAMIDEN